MDIFENTLQLKAGEGLVPLSETIFFDWYFHIFQNETSIGTGIFHFVSFGCVPFGHKNLKEKGYLFGHLARSRLARIDKVPFD